MLPFWAMVGRLDYARFPFICVIRIDSVPKDIMGAVFLLTISI